MELVELVKLHQWLPNIEARREQRLENQLILIIEVYKDLISGLYTSKEATGCWEPFKGICVGLVDSMDIL